MPPPTAFFVSVGDRTEWHLACPGVWLRPSQRGDSPCVLLFFRRGGDRAGRGLAMEGGIGAVSGTEEYLHLVRVERGFFRQYAGLWF